MKSKTAKLLFLPLLVFTAGPALAWPYAVRTVSIGMDNAVTTGSGGAPSWSEGQHFLQLCAGDFNSDGRHRGAGDLQQQKHHAEYRPR